MRTTNQTKNLEYYRQIPSDAHGIFSWLVMGTECSSNAGRLMGLLSSTMCLTGSWQDDLKRPNGHVSLLQHALRTRKRVGYFPISTIHHPLRSSLAYVPDLPQRNHRPLRKRRRSRRPPGPRRVSSRRGRCEHYANNFFLFQESVGYLVQVKLHGTLSVSNNSKVAKAVREALLSQTTTQLSSYQVT